jgi:nucleoside-diphosphate-sugar epimerase
LRLDDSCENNILVTGATGFIGHFLCSRLLAEGWSVRGSVLASERPAFLVAGVESGVDLLAQ